MSPWAEKAKNILSLFPELTFLSGRVFYRDTLYPIRQKQGLWA